MAQDIACYNTYNWLAHGVQEGTVT
jgi:hypothetical protein